MNNGVRGVVIMLICVQWFQKDFQFDQGITHDHKGKKSVQPRRKLTGE